MFRRGSQEVPRGITKRSGEGLEEGIEKVQRTFSGGLEELQRRSRLITENLKLTGRIFRIFPGTDGMFKELQVCFGAVMLVVVEEERGDGEERLSCPDRIYSRDLLLLMSADLCTAAAAVRHL